MAALASRDELGAPTDAKTETKKTFLLTYQQVKLFIHRTITLVKISLNLCFFYYISFFPPRKNERSLDEFLAVRSGALPPRFFLENLQRMEGEFGFVFSQETPFPLSFYTHSGSRRYGTSLSSPTLGGPSEALSSCLYSYMCPRVDSRGPLVPYLGRPSRRPI